MSKKLTPSFSQLLSREQFKNLGFNRDRNTCVFCSNPAKDFHHILDRKLFPDGGYYLSNGASVCEEHHWACEKTDISVEEVRLACGIKEFILPEGFDYSKTYDKWGNIIFPDGTREPGVMFWEENVQKILENKLNLFGF